MNIYLTPAEAEWLTSDRLKSFSIDEVSALVFRLDLAETIEPLDEVSSELREELIDELRERARLA